MSLRENKLEIFALGFTGCQSIFEYWIDNLFAANRSGKDKKRLKFKI